MPSTPIILGTHEPYSVAERQRVPFTLDPTQHTYVIGASGSGKTHLLRNILIQMIARGDGVGFCDPHGDLAEELLDHIPPERTRDVCYFNPADLRFPVAWNPLASIPQERQDRVLEGIVAAFSNMFGKGWGYQTEHLLSNAIAVLIAAENTSLLGIRRVLIDADYRHTLLKQVTDPLVLSFWHEEYEAWEPKFRLAAIAPLQNKLGALFRNPIARNILGQVQNRLDIKALMDNCRIFIARLPKGMIGTHTAKLLGALLMTQFQQAALERATIPMKDRVPFHLMIDEFQSFLTDEPEAFATTLAETRKYKLFLTLSHQFLAQIHDDELKHAVISNAGNLLIFRVSGHDAQFLEDTLNTDTAHIARKAFVTLPRGEVIVRLVEDGTPHVPFIGTVTPAIQNLHDKRRSIITQSRRTFTQPSHAVEEQITKFFQSATEHTKSKKPAVVRRAYY
jgi:energy-coupling factor transporter ATP-binding protein EcfA2